MSVSVWPASGLGRLAARVRPAPLRFACSRSRLGAATAMDQILPHKPKSAQTGIFVPTRRSASPQEPF